MEIILHNRSSRSSLYFLLLNVIRLTLSELKLLGTILYMREEDFLRGFWHRAGHQLICRLQHQEWARFTSFFAYELLKGRLGLSWCTLSCVKGHLQLGYTILEDFQHGRVEGSQLLSSVSLVKKAQGLKLKNFFNIKARHPEDWVLGGGFPALASNKKSVKVPEVPMAEDRTSAIVRQATRQDVPLILKLVRELADYEKLGATCVATEAGFENSLFKSLPFQGPTVFILETSPIVSSVSPQVFQPNTQQCSSFDGEKDYLQPKQETERKVDDSGAPEHYIKTQGLDVGDCVSQSRALSCISNVETQGHHGLHTNEGICALKLEREEEWIQEKDMLVLKLVKTSTKTHKAASSEEHVCEVTLRRTIVDTDAKMFMSPSHKNRTVIGFVLFFPNYSTFLAKPGCYVEDLYIREPYRGHGYGSFLLKTVAQQAVKHGADRVEWCVLDWNVNAINFYKRISATVMPEWKLCRLAGRALHTCKPEESPIQEPEVLQNLESFHFET